MNNLKVHHIGIKVRSIATLILSFEMLKIHISEIEDHPEVGLKIGCICLNNCIIELLEVTDEKSPMAKDPLGFNHIGLLSEDFFSFYQLVADNKEYVLVYDIFFNAQGKKIFFFKMKQEKDILYECMQA